MENATRAIIIAGGVLLTMMLTSLILFVFKQYQEYSTSSENEDRAKKISEFNLQYTNYDREDINGFELISLLNKVIDHNKYGEQKSDLDVFIPIEVKVNISKFDNIINAKLPYQLFTKNKYEYTQNDMENIFSKIAKIETQYGKTFIQKQVGAMKSTQDYADYYYQYYEYTQFKKSIFKCKKMDFDKQNGGIIKSMEFDFVKVE